MNPSEFLLILATSLSFLGWHTEALPARDNRPAKALIHGSNLQGEDPSPEIVPLIPEFRLYDPQPQFFAEAPFPAVPQSSYQPRRDDVEPERIASPMDKRAQTFVRFGKRAQTFVRFGKRAQTFVRFG
ncbi:FMRFamide-like neuropeptide 16 [Ditylenchus destructor]|uniref:FMRFamide-like neuropeptide 16 n=1 Tax=Ditylenchus destructor TaxID=166010 RepID=A0AAD4NFE1_9BILA|nr:FMRFamide-like neuropeptide 16 [Ditylenchus destructor]